MAGVERVVADVAGRDAQYGYPGWFGYLLLQAVEMVVDGCRLPAGVGEDGVVDFREDAVGGQGEQGTGLDTGAEGEGAEGGGCGDGASLRCTGVAPAGVRSAPGGGGG
ncbi:hypothetical protein ADK70_34375, partial [Streptomyces rimosus subsp. pseudoverticillatus]